MALDEEQGQAAGFGHTVLDLRPGGRRVFAVFLRSQATGGLSWHLSGHPACSGYTQLRLQIAVSGRTLTNIELNV